MTAIFMFAFWVYTAGALTIAWLAGDRGDRTIVIAVLLAALASSIAYSLLSPVGALLAVIAIDAALFITVLRYALRTARYWPLWFAGIQAAIVFFDVIALAFAPTMNLRADLVGGFWALAAMAVMAGGLLLDRQRGITGGGSGIAG